MSSISVQSTANAGENVRIEGKDFDPALKFALTTVDASGKEVGITTNTNRPAPDGTFHCGIKVPPKMPCRINAYQGSSVVAHADVALPVTPPPGQWPTQKPMPPQKFTSNGQWIRDAVIDIAPGHAMSIQDQEGKGNSIYGKALRGCGIENVTLRGREWGLLIVDMDDFHIGGNVRVVDVNYCGLGIFGGTLGEMQVPTIERVGTYRTSGLPTIGDAGNAYGIKFEVASQAGGSSGIPTDWTINGGLATDIPLWQGINAHQAKRLTINDFIVRRAPRAYFFAGGIDALTVRRSKALECSPAGSYGSGDKAGILLSGVTNASIIDNEVSKTFEPPATVYEVYGSAQVIAASGNRIVP